MTTNTFLNFLSHGGAKLLILGLILVFNLIKRFSNQAQKNASTVRTPPPIASPSAPPAPVVQSGTVNQPASMTTSAAPTAPKPAPKPTPAPRPASRSSRSKSDSPWSNSGGPFNS